MYPKARKLWKNNIFETLALEDHLTGYAEPKHILKVNFAFPTRSYRKLDFEPRSVKIPLLTPLSLRNDFLTPRI